MTVQDLWRRKDGTPSARNGRGLRWRVHVEGWPATSHRTRAEAEAVNAHRLTTQPPGDGGAATTGDLIERWRESKRGLSRGGYSGVRTGAGHALERWADTPPGSIESWQVSDWLAGIKVRRKLDGQWVQVPASAESKVKALAALRGALNIEVSAGRLPRNPCAGVTVPRKATRDPVFLTVKQLRALAEAAEEWGPLVWMLGTTGLRIGEAVALNVGDVDAGRGRCRVRRSKTGAGRDVPVTGPVLAMLDLERPREAPLFASSHGKRVNANNWRARVFVPMAERAGMPAGMHVHDLRHTAASLMIASGATVKDVQAALGHASARMTLDIYAGWFADGLDDVADRMGGLIA